MVHTYIGTQKKSLHSNKLLLNTSNALGVCKKTTQVMTELMFVDKMVHIYPVVNLCFEDKVELLDYKQLLSHFIF